MTAVDKFEPTSKIKGGKNGLVNTTDSKSHVMIKGPGLVNGLLVNVYFPYRSNTVVWTGNTEGAAGNHCRVKLDHPGRVAQGRMDGEIEVGVTVGGPTQQPFRVLTGPPLDGTYGVACNGTAGGTYKWLAPDGTTGVKLALASGTAPAWAFTTLNNQQGNRFTIQSVIGGYYLKWTNSGPGTNVSLVTAPGAGTGWLLDTNGIFAIDIPANDPGPPNYTMLNGDTQGGTANIRELADPNNGTSWSLGTYIATPPPHA